MIQALGLLVTLVLIVVLVVRRINYGVALLSGAFILGIFSQLTFQQFLEVFASALTNQATLDLALIVSLIPILALCMKETGMVNDLIASVRKVVSGRAVLMMLPALMGALPMPGGALLSAPLIDEEAERFKLTSEEKSFINVWFRHWNFFVYPLSSPLILATSLASTRLPDFTLYKLILIQVPPAVLYLLLGYLASIRKIRDDDEEGQSRDLKTLLSIPLNMAPIFLAVVLNIRGIHMAAALGVGVALVLISKKVSPRRAVSFLKKGFEWRLPLAIIGIMSLQQMIEYTDAVSSVLPYMEVTGLPTIMLLIIIDWTVGLATAMPTAGIPVIFPLAMVMIKNITPMIVSILYLTMIFSYLISPMHLCLILTIEYYKSNLQAVYRKLIPTAIVSYLITLIAALFLS